MAPLKIDSNSLFLTLRYAIGFAERSGPHAHIGWLSSLANATHQPYNLNNTGGPSIKVNFFNKRSKTFKLYSGKLHDTLSVQHFVDMTARCQCFKVK